LARICCCTGREILPHPFRRAVEKQGAVGGGPVEHVHPVEQPDVVAGHEAGLGDQVRGVDRFRAEPQVRDREAAGLLGVVDEVALCVDGRVCGEDLDGVLVGADRPVRTETEEDGSGGAC
jgi:hypothetical protein